MRGRGVALAVLVVVLMLGAIGFGVSQLNAQNDQLASQNEKLEELSRFIAIQNVSQIEELDLIRRRFHALERRITNQHRKIARLLLRVIQRAQRGEEVLITPEEVAGLFDTVGGGFQNGGGGGGAGGGGDTGGGGDQPPPPTPNPVPPTVGQGNSGQCPPNNPHC